jgi:hypothetical protein
MQYLLMQTTGSVCAACFGGPIIGIGVYPKLAMGMYDVRAVAVELGYVKLIGILLKESWGLCSRGFFWFLLHLSGGFLGVVRVG